MLVTLSTTPSLPMLMVISPGTHINSPGILQTSTGGNLSREGAAWKKHSHHIEYMQNDWRRGVNRTTDTK